MTTNGKKRVSRAGLRGMLFCFGSRFSSVATTADPFLQWVVRARWKVKSESLSVRADSDRGQIYVNHFADDDDTRMRWLINRQSLSRFFEWRYLQVERCQVVSCSISETSCFSTRRWSWGSGRAVWGGKWGENTSETSSVIGATANGGDTRPRCPYHDWGPESGTRKRRLVGNVTNKEGSWGSCLLRNGTSRYRVLIDTWDLGP